MDAIKRDDKPENFVNCAVCNTMYHITCAATSVTTPDDILLNKETVSSTHWFCAKCKGKKKNRGEGLFFAADLDGKIQELVVQKFTEVQIGMADELERLKAEAAEQKKLMARLDDERNKLSRENARYLDLVARQEGIINAMRLAEADAEAARTGIQLERGRSDRKK